MPHSMLIPLPVSSLLISESGVHDPVLLFSILLHPCLFWVCFSVSLFLPLSVHVRSDVLRLAQCTSPPATSSVSSTTREICGSPRELPIRRRDYETEWLAVLSLGTGSFGETDGSCSAVGEFLLRAEFVRACWPADIIPLASVTFALTLKHRFIELNQINTDACGALFLPYFSSYWNPEYSLISGHY